MASRLLSALTPLLLLLLTAASPASEATQRPSPTTPSPARSRGRNRLSGGVPPLPGTLVYLSLAGNQLSGPVGAALRRLPRLSFLDLGRNWFSGEVPGEVFAFSRIRYLQLRKNAFSGELRLAGRVPSGATVDLSHNALSGRVPPELATAAAVYLNGNRADPAVAAPAPGPAHARPLPQRPRRRDPAELQVPAAPPDIQEEEGERLTAARRNYKINNGHLRDGMAKSKI
ncbi:unnamed protein product [Miscanthus lutarioriparius]|uniref:Uncharacterized protein n=1 Tax=Miscanthus lutarioriparius TaxID=422564 RepID=A0A811SML9_9POAL|nr:unnamed protein product [Miscanthus lutarioriparius]